MFPEICQSFRQFHQYPQTAHTSLQHVASHDGDVLPPVLASY